MIYVGTSGYAYDHWENGVFYPKGLKESDHLKYYANHFNSVELNVSYYRLPAKKAIETWVKNTPVDFVFAAKGSRVITNSKNFSQTILAQERFLNSIFALRPKLRVVLWQFSPNVKADVMALENFCHGLNSRSHKLAHAFEFRNESWFRPEVYFTLKKYNYALCTSDSKIWPKDETITASFAYVRLHGSGGLYSSDYSDEALEDWAKKIVNLHTEVNDVYVYFNNDAFGYATKDAAKLNEAIARLISYRR